MVIIKHWCVRRRYICTNIPKHYSKAHKTCSFLMFNFQIAILLLNCNFISANSFMHINILASIVWFDRNMPLRKYTRNKNGKIESNDFNKFVYGMKLLVAWHETSDQIPYIHVESVKTKGMQCHDNVRFGNKSVRQIWVQACSELVCPIVCAVCCSLCMQRKGTCIVQRIGNDRLHVCE